MNKERRKTIRNIIERITEDNLEDIKYEIESVLSDEEYAFECMPEGLQYSMRGEASQEAQDNLQNAIDVIDEFLEADEEDMDVISEVQSYLEEAAI